MMIKPTNRTGALAKGAVSRNRERSVVREHVLMERHAPSPGMYFLTVDVSQAVEKTGNRVEKRRGILHLHP